MLNKAFLLLVFAVSFGTATKADSYLPAVEDILQVAQTLSLTDLDVHPDHKGSDGTGTLPGGARVEFDLHHNDTLDKIEARGHQTMPLADLMPILPAQFSSLSRASRHSILLREHRRLFDSEAPDSSVALSPPIASSEPPSGRLT